MRFQILACAAIAAGLAGATAYAQDEKTLDLGDAAPALSVSKFVKGDKIEKFEPGKLYVVEFWATWCGPCKVSIPHLSDLQEKYKDKVTFIGVSVWEEDASGVEPFVKEMGDKMAYTVAMDDVPEGKDGNEGKMAKDWMTAAGENGIPSAFIVNGEGKIAWIGHPMSMDDTLAKVVEGSYDLAAAQKERADERAAEGKMAELREKLIGHLENRDFKKAVEELDKAIDGNAVMERQLAMTKFMLMNQAGDTQGALEYATKLVDGVYKDDAQALNNMAWTLVDPENAKQPTRAEIRVSLKAAERANELTKGDDGPILDTYARAVYLSGDHAKALELQEKAVKAMGDDDEGVKKRLEQYKKALKDKAA